MSGFLFLIGGIVVLYLLIGAVIAGAALAFVESVSDEYEAALVAILWPFVLITVTLIWIIKVSEHICTDLRNLIYFSKRGGM